MTQSVPNRFNYYVEESREKVDTTYEIKHQWSEAAAVNNVLLSCCRVLEINL